MMYPIKTEHAIHLKSSSPAFLTFQDPGVMRSVFPCDHVVLWLLQLTIALQSSIDELSGPFA